MTCKDCIHYDVCEDNLKYIQERFLKGFTFGKSEFIDGEFCNLFKDKSLILEKPCNVGDCVYLIAPQWNGKENKLTILKGIVTDYEFNSDDRFNEYKAVFEKLGFKQTLSLNKYNISWFNDKSKAEAKLKELNNEQKTFNSFI